MQKISVGAPDAGQRLDKFLLKFFKEADKGFLYKMLRKKNITLNVIEYDDYVIPNNVVEEGEVDANYFQHVPYLDNFNAENGTHLVSAAGIHVEPMGIYGGKQSALPTK